MGSVNINFGEVEGGFDTIEEGHYPVVIEKVEVRESKSSDNNYFNWEMTISEGEHEGRKLWMITSLSPKALFRLKDVLDALGVLDDEMTLEWDEDVQITQSSGPLLLEPDVQGLAAMAVVTIEYDYDPKGRNKVDTIVSADEPEAVGAGAKKPGGGSAKPGGAAKKPGQQRRALR